jgi:Fic family protein
VEQREHMSANLHEILNFEAMAELAFSWPEERPLTLGTLGELQRVLVRGTAGELPDAGGVRNRVVIIGARGSALSEARFVPPPPGDQLLAGVENLLGWINRPPDIPTVVRAAMAHYQFETLHPFSDGNGRLGRLLVIVQLLRGAVIREPLLVVSPWFEKRRVEYQNRLFDQSRTGAWDHWIGFFAAGVAASAEESRGKVERLVELQGMLRRRVQDAGRRGKAEQVAADLISNPYVTIPDVTSRYGLSRQGALNIVRMLQQIGILRLAPFRAPNGAQYYVSSEVLEATS